MVRRRVGSPAIGWHGPLLSGTPAVVSFPTRCLLIASGGKLPPGLATLIAAALGFVQGWLNGNGHRRGRTGGARTGRLAAVTFTLVALVVAFVVSLGKP